MFKINGAGMLGLSGFLLKRFIPVIGFVAVCWAVFLVNNVLLGGALDRFGIVPRQVDGLPGIIFSPVLHVSLKHLIANTLPLVVLGAILCARGRSEFWTVTLAGALIGGVLTWIFGRKAYHIGASGLIFCYFGYVASLAWFRRTLLNFVLSVGCVLLYGGMLKGMMPVSGAISWESHLAGLIASVTIASFSQRSDKPGLRGRSRN